MTKAVAHLAPFGAAWVTRQASYSTVVSLSVAGPYLVEP